MQVPDTHPPGVYQVPSPWGLVVVAEEASGFELATLRSTVDRHHHVGTSFRLRHHQLQNKMSPVTVAATRLAYAILL